MSLKCLFSHVCSASIAQNYVHRILAWISRFAIMILFRIVVNVIRRTDHKLLHCFVIQEKNNNHLLHTEIPLISNQAPSFFLFLFLSVFVRDKCLLNKTKNTKIVDYINEVLNETVEEDDKQNLPEDWEEGLTFTARSSRKYHLYFLFVVNVWYCFLVTITLLEIPKIPLPKFWDCVPICFCKRIKLRKLCLFSIKRLISIVTLKILSSKMSHSHCSTFPVSQCHSEASHRILKHYLMQTKATFLMSS